MAEEYNISISGKYSDGTSYKGNFSVNYATGQVNGSFHDAVAAYSNFTLVDLGNSYALVSTATAGGVTGSLRIDYSVSQPEPHKFSASVEEKIYAGGDYSLKSSNTIIESCYACFRSGTRILTDKGPVAVENLAAGDMVVTAAGVHRPVAWIGHRTLDLGRHPFPRHVWPIRVEAGAFSEAVPARDLWLSPAHAVQVGGHLVQIERLVNGATITQVPTDRVTYWHVELDSHDVILAEGLAAETYLDTGNRTAFLGGGHYLEMHPDFTPRHWSETCLPMVETGPDLATMRQTLMARAEALGYAWTADGDLHVLADGVRIDAVPLGVRSFAFDLPPGCDDIQLVSRTWTPVVSTPDVEDYRSLGACVGVLHIDGADVSLADQTEGWSRYETDGTYEQRWTTGAARLPSGSRRLVVHLSRDGRYLATTDIELAVAA